MLSDRVRASRKPGIPDMPFRELSRSIYPEMPRFATKCGEPFIIALTSSGRFELCVALDEFLCSPARKTDGDAAVFFVTFDADDGSDSIGRMANLAAKHGIGISAAFYCWPAKRAYGACRLGCCHGVFRFAADPPQKLVGRVGIFGIGFITPLFA